MQAPLDHIIHAKRDDFAPFGALKPDRLVVHIVWAPPPSNDDIPLSCVS